ncbi:DUF7518 family protein [Halogranum rubrum]|uniref:DUF7518 family protein n=1 Tax=Halogranum rubrum TaxID=553466 RepID=UPI000677C49B|nr:hypothetical protein [Halogranum salarium]
MSNRVEELESKVKELQAAVNGLTEELVETKERVRQLEEEVDVDVAPAGRRRDRTAETTDEETQAEADKADDAKEGDDEEQSSGSDIIVA